MEKLISREETTPAMHKLAYILHLRNSNDLLLAAAKAKSCAESTLIMCAVECPAGIVNVKIRDVTRKNKPL